MSFRLTSAIFISIHALREEGDAGHTHSFASITGISIHALREEGDVTYKDGVISVAKFLSTPSARRATVSWLPL